MIRFSTRRLKARTLTVLCISLIVAAVSLVQSKAAAPYAVSIGISGTLGAGRIADDGIECGGGGASTYRHYSRGPLSPGKFSKLHSDLELNLDVETPGQAVAFFVSDQSHTTLSNRRGSVQLGVSAGSCQSPSLVFNGRTLSGTGTWSVTSGTYAYVGTTGSGTFSVVADLAPGADNPWNLQLAGTITVLQPKITASVIHSTWRHFGADYAGRIATVVYRVVNEGPGYAYDVQLSSLASNTTGVTPYNFAPTALGDLDPGEYVDVKFRFTIGHSTKGVLITVGREFDTTLSFNAADALDVVGAHISPVHVIAPAFPPPL